MNLRDEILRTCLSRYEGKFASGTEANNKLDLEMIYDNSDLFDAVTLNLGQAVLEYNPEFVVGVPDGATRLADAVAKRCDLHSVHLKRMGPDRSKMEFKDDFIDREIICSPLSRGVLIEDVFNRFTNTRRTLAIPELSKRIVAVAAIWDRGEEPRDRPNVPARALIEEPIPAMLPEDSELWTVVREA